MRVLRWILKNFFLINNFFQFDMVISNPTEFDQSKISEGPISRKQQLLQKYFYPILLFGGLGGLTWAIRGSSGWGGFDGALIPGLTWGLIWVLLSCKRGCDQQVGMLWLGLGIGIGGMPRIRAIYLLDSRIFSNKYL